MMPTMQAAFVEQFGSPLVIKEVAVPTVGAVKADIELQPLSAINDVLARLEHGDVASRVVLTL